MLLRVSGFQRTKAQGIAAGKTKDRVEVEEEMQKEKKKKYRLPGRKKKKPFATI